MVCNQLNSLIMYKDTIFIYIHVDKLDTDNTRRNFNYTLYGLVTINNIMIQGNPAVLQRKP